MNIKVKLMAVMIAASNLVSFAQKPDRNNIGYYPITSYPQVEMPFGVQTYGIRLDGIDVVFGNKGIYERESKI